MLLQRPLLSGSGNRLALVLVCKIMLDKFNAFLRATVGHHLLARYEHLVQILLPIGHQECAHTCGLVKARIIRVRASRANMMIQSHLRPVENLEHLTPPCGTYVSRANRRVVSQSLYSVGPNVHVEMATKMLQPGDS